MTAPTKVDAAVEGAPLTLTDGDLPELHHSGDAISLANQRRFVRSTAAQLVLLVVAAGAAALEIRGDAPRGATIVAAAAFLGAALLKVQILATQPERAWYEGRAVAESAKTLAWRFAVGGEPFPIRRGGERKAKELFLLRLREIGKSIDLPLVGGTSRLEQITDGMERLRAQPLAVRRTAYEIGRLRDQLDWYTRKAVWNERRGRMWNGGMLALMVVGGLLALISLTSGIDLDVVDAVAASVGAIGAWIATKQHQTLASAYSVTARELADILSLAEAKPRTEADWASFVSQAEEAVSREHSLWASRGK
jgi:hypothetical protein